MGSLLIRCDAGVQIGVGHVMRCIALAQGWKHHGSEAMRTPKQDWRYHQGNDVIFVCAELKPELHRRLNSEFSLNQIEAMKGSKGDAEATIAIAKSHGVQWIVIDSYHFGADYQKRIKDAGFKLLCIDDYGHAEHYYSDYILNQNIYASDTDYFELTYPNREPYTQPLMGTRYTMLRREFLSWKYWQREIPPRAHKILITLGGGNYSEALKKVLKAIAQLDDDQIEVQVVCGSEHIPTGSESDAKREGKHISYLSYADNMPELMADADLCITGGGSTCWETAFMGLPALTLVMAENQAPIAEHLARHRITVNLGWSTKVTAEKIKNSIEGLIADPEKRSEMSRLGRELVDGEGVNRIIDVLARN
jgi:UDP-2,4-diacetamido-2,4,6-trideoxy-beta-L-altropyranose hydrolase